MDACARIRGVPVRSRAAVRKETVRDSGAQCVKSLFRNKKELCSICLELPPRDTTRLTEIHFVCLPGHCDGEDVTQQALPSLPGGLCELLRSVHVQSLKNDEVLLLRDSRRLAEHKDAGPQWWLKTVCVLRHNPTSSIYPQSAVASLLGLLGCYMAGIRYTLEQQVLQRSAGGPSQQEEDDTNQSVSSIEDDFVTALEHLEEDDTGDNPSAASYRHFKKRDVASQTVPSHKRRKELLGSRVIISSSSKKYSTKHTSGPDVSVTVQRSAGMESQWTYCSPGARFPSPPIHVSESEESDCSSPSPIIFLDEVGYQKSLLAKLDIPQVPGGPRERVEDSDSEVSEFFDSFDQFDDLEELSSESCTLALPLDTISAPTTQKKPADVSTSGSGSKYVSRGCSTKGMNPHRFDPPTLPANVKKPTPLKPGSPYSLHSEVPDSPRPVQTPSDENGGPLFSPVSSSAFSPLTDCSGTLEYFWKTDDDGQDSSELRKPQDLCSLYKTYSDFASSLSKEILGSVCGYQSAVDISDNKNLSCVCHKEFKNPSGYLMKLSEIQETVTVAKLQEKSQSLKDGIQRFATDLVEMSLGSALRDLQKGVSSCTTTLCHLAARLTSSVFQMAFHEIGMRHAYVLKERAINGLAGFLVGEALSGALAEFLTVKKQIFHSTVTRFAADLAEELVFEGIMEVCQFSHPSTPRTPSDWTFGRGQEEEEEEEVVSSYASDLSESVLQEAFIELSQADVAFTSQAAISVSLDNICYVSAENTSTHTCSTFANQQVVSASSAAPASGPSSEDATCTVKKALFTVSGMASCIPVPKAGQALSYLQDSEEASQNKSGSTQNSPKRLLTQSFSDTTTSTQTHHYSHDTETQMPEGDPSQGKSTFQNFSGNMVDMIVTEACELITASKMKKSFGECADFLTKTIGNQRVSSSKQTVNNDALDSSFQQEAIRESFKYDCKDSIRKGGFLHHSKEPNMPHISFQTGRASCETDPRNRGVAETHPVLMDTLDVPGSAMYGQRRISVPGDESAPNSGQKSGGTPGTPPSTPQQPSEVSKEKQIKQFSKKLKSKLAKEFSPATPPPTPHYQPEPGPGPKDTTPDADKAEFMLKLMRSLSEEADGNEDEEEEQLAEEAAVGVRAPNRCAESGHGGHEFSKTSARRMSNKEALHYAERLACHIVSMATEMDTLGVSDEEEEIIKGSEKRRDSVAQFSEQTLNTLWVYAGEVAGEVINDVKRMVSSGQQCPYHRALRRRSFDRSNSECSHHHYPSQSSTDQNFRVGKLAEQWSNDLIASVLRTPTSTSSTVSSTSSGLSSEYPSCESVTDEYAGYLIRVLKKEGGSRELVLDQYASRLAYRSIKLGLAHASRKIKQRSCTTRLHFSRSLPDEWKASGSEASSPKERAESAVTPSGEDNQCCCKVSEEQSQREYMDLVNFAESLAYNITCDVTRKLHLSSVRLPKSLTDSCLYKKSKLEDMTENLIRNSFSCPLLSKEGRSRHYHSTGSLYDGGYSSRVMQVIEHYARKIVDDTLKMSLASIGHPSHDHQRKQDHERHSHTQRLSDALRERTCHYCQVQECPYCSKLSSHHHQHVLQRRRRGPESQVRAERLTGLEIPKIHINLDHRAVFAEEMVSMAMETAKRELSNTSLNADSGIGHDGTSYAESLTAEIMTSALSNICQAANISSQGRETTESTVSQQLSVGDDSLGSWSNLSFEDEHLDDNSSFLHLSDSSNGNSSSWSSLGLEGEACEERLSSPSDSDHTEDKETEVKEESSGTLCADRTQMQAPRTVLLMVNSDVREPGRGPQHVALDSQLRSMLQWVAASMADIPQIQLSPDRELQQLPAVVQRLRERRWRVGELMHTLLRYCEESQVHSEPHPREEALQAGRETHRIPLFQWLLEHA
ncbi:A-kinase anchor protein 11 isoform X1 [Sphaeramia orbicularis]|uniref:A-kinase anchor protein 11 isoform X1 n=1 Tax=Sphaeramia orbicularis TaxID=375764 RepID=UPI0011806D08|nr:A-kinase anchor protein 11 isoform X1 [Sphaeramia orbicularis]XP_029980416.1 A-kinase anchor protein 11 isoform X1 [Sphaeramia orbicularis]XP_029980417.1 A-kinase anchor protein 11 isoform X1 [Sphaeramia orbicularis]